MAQRIQVRRDTAANWTSVNPVLADGEQGLERDTKQTKFGDGVTAWNALDYTASSEQTARSLGWIFVTDKQYAGGAKGDRVTNDTVAIQAALTAGAGRTVYFPPGIYSITAPLTIDVRTTVTGPAVTLYPNFSTDWQVAEPSWGFKAATIQYASGGHGAIFSGGSQCSFSNLVLRSPQARSTSDVVFATNPSHFEFKRCTVQNMHAARYDLGTSWGAGLIDGNQFTGCSYAFGGTLVDCKITNNTFTSMANNAFYLSTGAGLNLFSGNRFEFGEAPSIVFYTGSRYNQVLNNIFDAHATYAMAFIQTGDPNDVIGNLFWRNGRTMPGDWSDCHLYVQASSWQNISANTFRLGGPDTGGAWSGPRYILCVDALPTHKIQFKQNTTREGSTSSTVFVDRFGNSSRCVEIDALDIPPGQAPNTGSDDLAASLTTISRLATAQVVVHIGEDRSMNGALNAPNVLLRGIQGTPTVTSSGDLSGLAAADNITFGGQLRTAGKILPPTGTPTGYVPTVQANGTIAYQDPASAAAGSAAGLAIVFGGI